MNLVFASGFFEPQKLVRIDYFRDLPKVYPDALFPEVPVDAHISERAPRLAQQILERFPKGDIHVIAHSMGGLDTRYLLAKKLLGLDQRIKSLSTISTPHRGSPVADLLLGLIPGIDSAPFQKFLNHFPAVGSGALDDLSTKAAVTFNQEIKLLRACQTEDRRHLRALIIVAVDTGARFGELIKLRKAQTDFTGSGTIYGLLNIKTSAATSRLVTPR